MSSKKKKKQHLMKVYFGIFVTVLMVTSLGGYFVSNQNGSEGIKVTIGTKEYDFVPNERSFSVKSEYIGSNVDLFYYPSDLDGIEFPDYVGRKLLGSPSVVVTFDPGEIDISYQNAFRIQMNDDFIRARKIVHNGVTKPSEQYNFPIFTCENATDYQPVILLKNSNSTTIYETQNCIHIEANNVEFFKIRDKIAHYIFGFMN